MKRLRFLLSFFALILLMPGLASASDCDDPEESWLMCEDFEGGAQGWASWWEGAPFIECLGCSDGVNDPNRIYLTDDPALVYDGDYALRMPAEAEANYRGADLIYRSCQGETRQGCTLENHDTLYFRARVRLDDDHQYVHHFLSIGGSRPDGYWESYGNAGCRPNGTRAAGTTVDFNTDHELFFYTYTPDMRCDSGGYCSGDYVADICAGCATKEMACGEVQECCWGNSYSSDPRPVLPKGEWVCLEMMMKLNSPGASDGEMTFWMNDVVAHQQEGMLWRTVPELGLNQVRLQHYIASGDASQSNRITFDDMIVSTERIGCSPTIEPVDQVESSQEDTSVAEVTLEVDETEPTGSDASEIDVSEVEPLAEVDEGLDSGEEDASVGLEEDAADSGEDEGCGCQLRGRSERGGLWGSLFVLLGLFWFRRHRDSETKVQ